MAAYLMNDGSQKWTTAKAAIVFITRSITVDVDLSILDSETHSIDRRRTERDQIK